MKYTYLCLIWYLFQATKELSSLHKLLRIFTACIRHCHLTTVLRLFLTGQREQVECTTKSMCQDILGNDQCHTEIGKSLLSFCPSLNVSSAGQASFLLYGPHRSLNQSSLEEKTSFKRANQIWENRVCNAECLKVTKIKTRSQGFHNGCHRGTNSTFWARGASDTPIPICRCPQEAMS
jgi:hypothetical protein